jgi:YfdX protein
MRRFCFGLIPALVLTGAAWCQDTAEPGLPNLAASVLQQTDLARKALDAHDKMTALGYINMASLTAAEIQKRGGPAPVLVPVRTEVEATSTYLPVKHRDGEMTASRMKKDTSIRDVEGETTTSNLNVTAAAGYLADAQTALERDDFAGAQNALTAVSNSIVTTKSVDDMPLLMAKQNLDLARSRVLEGKYRDAVVPLHSAAQALGMYAKQFPGPNAEQAEDMRVDIDAYADTIAHHHEDALLRIDGWLDPVNHWYAGKIPK